MTMRSMRRSEKEESEKRRKVLFETKKGKKLKKLNIGGVQKK